MALALALSFVLTTGAATADTWDQPRVERLLAGITGTGSGQCASCHAATAPSIRRWADAALQLSWCLQNERTPPITKVSCLRASDEPVRYSPAKLGLLAAGLHTQRFTDIFKQAFPEGEDAAREQAEMVKQAGMPTDGIGAMSDAQFQEIFEWVAAGTPLLSTILRPDPAQQCVDEVTPAYKNHMAAMAANGWGAKHRDAALPMFGCPNTPAPTDCLLAYPDLTPTIGTTATPQTIRHLIDLPRKSSYWVRSSADGRYVAFGSSQSAILDLEAVRTGRGAAEIGIAAPFDPEFMADNRSFSYAGTDRGIAICKQSLLTRLQNADKPYITLWEPECSPIGNGTYQSFGASLDGDRFLITTGTYMSDYGGEENPGSAYSRNATFNIGIFTSDGLGFPLTGSAQVGLPFRSEPILSPSGLAVASRFGANDTQSGFEVNFVDTQVGPGYSYVRLTKGAQICTQGGKASFSFDERFLVTHRYDGVPSKTSNIVLMDLADGSSTQLTDMPPGSFALFPHFRADGWIYFLVKEPGKNGREYVAATDAARLR